MSKNVVPIDLILPCPMPLNVVILLVFTWLIEKFVSFINDTSAPVSSSSVTIVLVCPILTCMNALKLRLRLYTLPSIDLILGECRSFPNVLRLR